MANVQKISGKRGTSYRVQFMRNGRRVGQTFPRKKDAEAFLAQITVSDDLADALTNVTLTTTTLSQAQALSSALRGGLTALAPSQWAELPANK